MKPFPGKIRTIGQGHRMVLNDEQKAWLVRWYPVTENSRVADAMGIGVTRVHDFAREFGLVKSEKGIKAIRHRRDLKAAKTNEANGCYDRKRGHPCSEATMNGLMKRWQKVRDGLIESIPVRMKRENPEKYQEWMRKRSVERKESIRKEKLRVLYGLERKTRLTAVVMTPYRKSQTSHRVNALKRGYILTEDCSEGNPDRYIIYYDEETKRSPRFEANCVADGFKIMEWIYG